MPRGRLQVGGPALQRPRLATPPRTSRPPIRQKASTGTLPLVIPSIRGAPLRMKEQGDLGSGGDVTEGSTGLPSHKPLAHTPTPGLRALWRQRAAYRGMWESCGVQGMAWALPGPERAPGPERTTGKFPSLGQRGSSGLHRLLPRGLVLLTRARVLPR